MDAWQEYWHNWLKKREQSGLRRSLRPIEVKDRGGIALNGSDCLDLSSNDYLGFAREVWRPVSPLFPGAGASRLITGDLEIHHRLEERLARLKDAGAALLYPSGFQANLGLMTALAGRDCTIVADRLNHASLVDGARLSGARLHRYAHKDTGEARAILQAIQKESPSRRCLLVTDAVFSMDGDIAPLADLLAIAVEFGALLVVDEAHATGVLGLGGAGAWHAAGLPPISAAPAILMGTLSKALGAQGGFVCGSKVFIDYLVNCSRPYIYSTGISPLVVAAALHALDRLEAEPHLLCDLWHNVEVFGSSLREAGLDPGAMETPILPVITGDALRTVQLSKKLEERGILGVAIRPPTVPEGSSRLRFTVTAVHDPAQLEQAAHTVGQVLSSSA